MQNCTTILGIIDMRQRGISYDDCRSRYKVGCSTITLIMNRFKESGKDLDTLKQMSAEEVEHLFFPPENLRRKDDSVMPDYQAVYERLTMPGSKANLFYLWLKYKKDCPSGYQYTQYCLYFKRFVEKHYGSEAVCMVVERIPGEKVYIDWVGDQPEILVDSSTGEIKKVHFFVTIFYHRRPSKTLFTEKVSHSPFCINVLRIRQNCYKNNDEYSGWYYISCPVIWKSLFRFAFVHTES